MAEPLDEVPPFLIRRALPSKSGVLLEQKGDGEWVERDLVMVWPTLEIRLRGKLELAYPMDVLHQSVVFTQPEMDCTFNGQQLFALQIVSREDDSVVSLFAANQQDRDDWAVKLRKHAVHVDIENGFQLDGRVLGTGNYASVYLARDLVHERDVALKVIEKSRLTEEERKLLADEVLVSKAADNAFCVQTLEFIELGEQYVLVVEYMEGGDLYDRVVCEQVLNHPVRNCNSGLVGAARRGPGRAPGHLGKRMTGQRGVRLGAACSAAGTHSPCYYSSWGRARTRSRQSWAKTRGRRLPACGRLSVVRSPVSDCGAGGARGGDAHACAALLLLLLLSSRHGASRRWGVLVKSEGARATLLRLTHVVWREQYGQVDVKHLFRQLLIGVAHLHSRNLCHRDLKPENFLLTGERPFSVKIADFGIATRVDPQNRTKCLKDGDRLRCSPGYGAPEIVRREAYGLPADMWSVGVLLYFMLTGLSPFHGNTKDETLALMSKGHYDREPLQKHGPAVLDLVTHLLEYNPEKRLSAAMALKHPWVCETVLMTVEEPEGEEMDKSSHGGVPARLLGATLEGAFRNPSLHEMSVEKPKTNNLYLDVSVHDSFWKNDDWLKSSPQAMVATRPPAIDETSVAPAGDSPAGGDDSDVGSRSSLDSSRGSLDQAARASTSIYPGAGAGAKPAKKGTKFAPLGMISQMVKKVRLRPSRGPDETVHGLPCGE